MLKSIVLVFPTAPLTWACCCVLSDETRKRAVGDFDRLAERQRGSRGRPVGRCVDRDDGQELAILEHLEAHPSPTSQLRWRNRRSHGRAPLWVDMGSTVRNLAVHVGRRARKTCRIEKCLQSLRSTYARVPPRRCLTSLTRSRRNGLQTGLSRKTCCTRNRPLHPEPDGVRPNF